MPKSRNHPVYDDAVRRLHAAQAGLDQLARAVDDHRCRPGDDCELCELARAYEMPVVGSQWAVGQVILNLEAFGYPVNGRAEKGA